MDLRDIRVALAGIAAGFGFDVYSYLPENPSTPAAVVGVPTVEYGASLKLASVTLPVILVVNKADGEAGQILLDAAMSTHASSLVDAYNGAVDSSWKSCKVVRAGNVREVTVGGSSALAADIELELIA